MKKTMFVILFEAAALAAVASHGAWNELLPVPKSIAYTGGEADATALERVTVRKAAVKTAPKATADEAYRLVVAADGVTVEAATERGVRYAKVTLAQLRKLAGGGRVAAADVADWPDLRWRGFMPDTARNYLDLDSFKAVVDVMGAYKLNLLHWHLSENYAWRLESKRYPQLQSEKAFVLRHRGKFYTQEDFLDMVAYCRERGITVMPELDVPGHAQAFRNAFGFASMSDPRVGPVIADLLDELCRLVPAEQMPFIHVGGDEVWNRDLEGATPEALKLWAETLARNGRTLVNWNPGEKFPPVVPRVSMMWGCGKIEHDGPPVFDANGMYIETLDPFEILPRAAFHKTCRWPEMSDNRRWGAIFCAWHDGFTGLPYANMLRNQQILPSCVMFGQAFWNGCLADRPDLCSRMPCPNDRDFAAVADFERRVIAQRDKVLYDLEYPFHFLKQSDMRWRLTDRDGRLIARDIACASISPFKSPTSKENYVTNATGLVTMETWIRSPKTQRVGVWIGFTNIDRDHGLVRAQPLPRLGEWTRFGSKVELNGEEIAPPRWKRPGLVKGRDLGVFPAWKHGPYELDEEPYGDQEYFMREPAPITLREEWNHVKLTLPMTEPVSGWGSHQWIGTFIPLLGTTDHPREVPGLEYSCDPPRGVHQDATDRGDICPHWISVMPLIEGNAASVSADAVSLGENTIIDGIAWNCSIHPEGDPPADKAAIYATRWRETEPLVRRGSRVKQGVLLQATMGHGGFPGSRTPWQLAVHPDGTETYRFCPLDPRFLEYIAHACRTFDAERPDFFMVDDDTRLVWPPVPGCFCPLHLAKLASVTGRSWRREEVVKQLLAKDPAITAAWDRIKTDSLAGLFKTIRANFSPSVPGILCVAGVQAHLFRARMFAEILAAPGQAPVIRGCGAPYHGGGLEAFHVADMRASYARQIESVGSGVVYMQEADTCPQTLWACSAVREVNHLVMLALDGMKGAKIWITRTANIHEKRSFETYLRELRAQRGIMEWAARTDFRPEGVVLPYPDFGKKNLFSRYLSQMGIPCRFGRARPGEVTALDGAAATGLPTDEIRTILAGRVLLDSLAAIRLVERGFEDEIGVKAKAWSGPTIQFQEFADGVRQSGCRRDKVADLSCLLPGAKELSGLYNRPRMGDPARKVAPGSVLFVNAFGGRILSLAMPAPATTEEYHASQLYSETYKDEIVKALVRLSGAIPGGVYYRGACPALCVSGSASADGRVFALNLLGGDDDPTPEVKFDAPPARVERLGGDGVWRQVTQTLHADGSVVLDSPVRPQRAAIFRYGR